jgi:hypothetical protein
MQCPGCGSCSSTITAAFREDRPCPDCGLSSDAAAEILGIQRSRADETLKAHLTEALKAKGIAEGKLRRAEYRLEQIREAMDAGDPDWL